MMKEFSMHILDIAQNSIKAGATLIELNILKYVNENQLIFIINDNGCGMNEEMVQKIRDPFTTSRTTRKVGLGIPMLEQTCIQCAGKLDIESKINIGTKITATLQLNNIDLPPMGDLINTIHMLIVLNENIDFIFKYVNNNIEFIFDTREVREVLGEVKFSEIEISMWIKENIQEGIIDADNNIE